MKRLFIALILVCAFASFASGEECTEMLPLQLFDSTGNCSSQPEISRVFDARRFEWRGHHYIYINRGNEIEAWNIDNPRSPQPQAGSGSWFNVPNVGDSDYDLINLAICDDCRYGVAS